MMKTINKTFLTFVSALVLIFISGCEDLLETPVQVDTTVDNFYKTPQDANFAVTAAYSIFKAKINAQGLMLGDMLSDDAWKGGKAYADGGGYAELTEFRFRTSNEELSELWGDIYRGIYGANLVINKVPDIDMDGMEEQAGYNLKQRYLAEARWVRAYMYFRLVTMFQAGPLITDLLPPEDFYSVPMATEAQIYEQIIKDLQYGIEVPEENTASGKSRLPKKSEYGHENLGRITIAAAKALLAKAYMYQNNNWDEVKRLTKEIIDDPQYDLHTPFSEIFLPESENNSESVIEFQFTESNNGERTPLNNGNLIFTMHAGLDNNMWVSKLGAPRNGWAWNNPSHNLYEAFENGDPRHDFTFLEAGEPYPHDTTVITTRGASEGPNAYAPGYLSEKMMIPPDFMPVNQTDGGNNVRYMRTAEVYLIYAEACYHTGDEPQARWAINQVRARARTEVDLAAFPNALPDIGDGVTGEELLNAIWQERRVELAMEGHRFFDLVRQSRIRPGRVAEVMNNFFKNPVNANGDPMISLDNPFVTGEHEYLPIPKSETDLTGGNISK